MTSRDRDMELCQKCPLPDCRESDPRCFLRKEKLKGKIGEEDIPFPVGLRMVARKLGVAYETIRFRIKNGQWDKLPKLFRTAPGGDWKCNPSDLEDFLVKMQGGAA